MNIVVDLVPVRGENNLAALVTLNRPEAKNALNRATGLELAQTLDKLRNRKDVKVIVIKGAGGSFCADLKDPVFADPKLTAKASFMGPENFLWQLRHVEVPVIAAVDGPCITGGMEIALNCDIIIATESAFFQDTHGRYGIVPGGGMTTLLPRTIGLHAAKHFSLAGQRMGAKRAYELGLVSQVVEPQSDLKAAALELAGLIMSCSQDTVRKIKSMQHSGLKYDVQTALEHEANLALTEYQTMSSNPGSTQEHLSSKFRDRSKL